MSFVDNLLEDLEQYLIANLNQNKVDMLREQEQRLAALKSSYDYRRTDLIYLAKEGFDYDKRKDTWTKNVHIDYGRYPGDYAITIKFPQDYPQIPPRIYFMPGPNVKNYSEHLMHRGEVCIASKMHGMPNSYWKKYMNIKGALRLAYNAVTDDLADVKIPSEPIKGTIFEDLSKVVKKEEFIVEFILPLFSDTQINSGYTWEQIAAVLKKTTPETKKAMIAYYNLKKKGKNKPVYIQARQIDDDDEDDE